MKTYMPPTLANIKEWMARNLEVHEVQLIPRKTGISNAMVIPLIIKTPMTLDAYKEKVEQFVCAEFQVQPSQIRSRTRKHDIVLCRQLIYKFIRERKNTGFTNIAGMYGYNHANVIHGIKTVNDRIATDKYIRSKVANIKDKLDKL